MSLLSLQADLFSLVLLAVFLLKVVALISALGFPAEAFSATGRLTKAAWVGILAVSLVVDLILGLGILWVISVVAVLVYWVDVRPALRSILGRR